MIFKFEKGFTLIEVLVTIGILSLISGIVTDTFFNVYRNYQKANITNEAKQTGQHILSLVEKSLRDAGSAIVDRPPNRQVFVVNRKPNFYQEIGCISGNATTNGYIYQRVGSNTSPESLLTNNSLNSGLDVYDCDFRIETVSNTKVAKVAFKIKESVGAASKLELKADVPFELTVVLRNQ